MHANTFANFAPTFYEAGLNIIPCENGEEGKAPSVKWGHLCKRKLTASAFEKMLMQHPTANIGLIAGAVSGLTILDIDDPEISLHDAFKEFGETPVVVRTPSGGFHLYYQYGGENKQIRYGGRKIDIIGEGGYALAPPSYNRASGKGYQFIIGSELDLSPDFLPKIVLAQPHQSYECVEQPNAGTVGVGQRNKALFKMVKDYACDAPDQEDLLQFAIEKNKTLMRPPLPDSEVKGIVRSVEGYKKLDKLMRSGEQTAQITRTEFDIVKQYGPAHNLFMEIKLNHAGLRDTFCLSADAHCASLGMSKKTYIKARDFLLSNGFIRLVYQGGRFKGDVSLYAFCF